VRHSARARQSSTKLHSNEVFTIYTPHALLRVKIVTAFPAQSTSASSKSSEFAPMSSSLDCPVWVDSFSSSASLQRHLSSHTSDEQFDAFFGPDSISDVEYRCRVCSFWQSSPTSRAIASVLVALFECLCLSNTSPFVTLEGAPIQWRLQVKAHRLRSVASQSCALNDLLDKYSSAPLTFTGLSD